MDNFLESSTTTKESEGPITATSVPSSATASSFLESLPEELRTNPSLTKFKDIPGLAKSHVELEKMIGNSVRIPGQDAKPEDMKAFLEKVQTVPGITYLDTTNEESIKNVLTKLGRPESPDKYDFKDVPIEVDDKSLGVYKEKAHQLGLTNEQARQVALALKEDRDRFESARVEQATVLREKSINALKKEWGADYENKISEAKEAFKLYKQKFPEEAKLLQDSSGNNPLVARLLSDMHNALKEKSHIQGSGPGTNGLSVEQAMVRKKEILDSNRDTHPYYNIRHPDHDKFVKEIDSLYDIISPVSKS